MSFVSKTVGRNNILKQYHVPDIDTKDQAITWLNNVAHHKQIVPEQFRVAYGNATWSTAPLDEENVKQDGVTDLILFCSFHNRNLVVGIDLENLDVYILVTIKNWLDSEGWAELENALGLA